MFKLTEETSCNGRNIWRTAPEYLVYRLLIIAVVNVKEEPGSNVVSTSSVGTVGVPSGMMSSAVSSGVSTTGFAPMEFQTRSKCFM